MKLYPHLSIILILCFFINFLLISKAQENFVSRHNFTLPFNFIKKYALALTSIPLLMYQHQTLQKIIEHHPYVSSLCLYCMLYGVSDMIMLYEKEKSILNVLELLNAFSLKLLIGYGINNYLEQHYVLHNKQITSDSFLSSISKNLMYSFDDITTIVLKTYHELKTSILTLNPEIKIQSEEFVFLCHTSSINLTTMLYLVQHDEFLYKTICKFEKNPEEYIELLREYLQIELSKDFLILEKELITIYNKHILAS